MKKKKFPFPAIQTIQKRKKSKLDENVDARMRRFEGPDILGDHRNRKYLIVLVLAGSVPGQPLLVKLFTEYSILS